MKAKSAIFVLVVSTILSPILLLSFIWYWIVSGWKLGEGLAELVDRYFIDDKDSRK